MKRTITKLFGVDDVRVYPIKKDCEKEYTCRKGGELPGVRQVSLTYEVEKSKDLLKPGNILSVHIDMEYAHLKPSEVKRIRNKQCQVKAQILDIHNDGGDIHFVIYKANLVVEQIDKGHYRISGKGIYTTHKFDEKTKLLDIEIHHKPEDLKPTESRVEDD